MEFFPNRDTGKSQGKHQVSSLTNDIIYIYIYLSVWEKFSVEEKYWLLSLFKTLLSFQNEQICYRAKYIFSFPFADRTRDFKEIPEKLRTLVSKGFPVFRALCLLGSSVQTFTKCCIITLSSKAEERQTPRPAFPCLCRQLRYWFSKCGLQTSSGLWDLFSVLKIKTVFITILRCYLPFSLYWHSQWRYKSNNG